LVWQYSAVTVSDAGALLLNGVVEPPLIDTQAVVVAAVARRQAGAVTSMPCCLWVGVEC